MPTLSETEEFAEKFPNFSKELRFLSKPTNFSLWLPNPYSEPRAAPTHQHVSAGGTPCKHASNNFCGWIPFGEGDPIQKGDLHCRMQGPTLQMLSFCMEKEGDGGEKNIFFARKISRKLLYAPPPQIAPSRHRRSPPPEILPPAGATPGSCEPADFALI
jgi:hypothetical protein